MQEGTVKWFNAVKGFGFITQDGGEDVFVHHTQIVADGFRTLAPGDRVAFEVTRGPKGLQAFAVSKGANQSQSMPPPVGSLSQVPATP